MPEPNVKEQAIDTTIGQDLDEFIKDLRHKVVRDSNNRERWNTKLINASNQRMGIKRSSNYPYQNAPDIPLPETDKVIKKSTPPLVLSIWNARKIARVSVKETAQESPQLKQQANLAEQALNMVLRKRMNLYDKLELSADFAKEKGHCIFKVVEDFNSRQVRKVINLDDYDKEVIKRLKKLKNKELKIFLAKRYNLNPDEYDDDKKTIDDIVDQFRSGEDVIEFNTEQITSLPNIETPLPENVIVPDYTTDIRFAERITEEFWLTEHELEERMEQGIYEQKDLEDISFTELGKNKDDKTITANKRRQEGVSEADKGDLYRIQEVSCWYKPKDDWERWVFTFLADVTDVERSHLRHIPFPFEFEGWNYYRFDNEKRDPRHHSSRGEPEKVRALQEVMERSINNMLIRDEHNNNPIYEVVDTSEILDRGKTLAPGEMVPVSQLGAEIKRLDDARNVDMSGERILQLIKANIEEYVGSTDQLFNNATNAGGGKTLGEIQHGVQDVQPLRNKEVIRWNQVLSKVFTAIFEVMKERLGESIYIEGQPITREIFNFPADVVANGTVEVADQRLSTQKAWMRLQAAINMLQAGVSDVEDVYNAYRDWLEKDGVRDPEEFSTHPQKIMEKQLAQMKQQIQQGTQQFKAIQKKIEKGWKDLAKNKMKMKELQKEFEGELEATEEIDNLKKLLGDNESDKESKDKK